MKKFVVAVTAFGCLSAASVMAEPAKSDKQAQSAVQFRQALFQLVRSNVGILGAMSKGAVSYDAEIMQKNGMRMEQLSLMLEDYFKTDTSKFDVETEALDKIWTNGDDFSEKAQALTAAAKNLQAVAKSGDEGQYKQAIGEVFKSCKGCHDNYKAE